MSRHDAVERWRVIQLGKCKHPWRQGLGSRCRTKDLESLVRNDIIEKEYRVPQGSVASPSKKDLYVCGLVAVYIG
jgi:hypothetical protein